MRVETVQSGEHEGDAAAGDETSWNNGLEGRAGLGPSEPMGMAAAGNGQPREGRAGRWVAG